MFTPNFSDTAEMYVEKHLYGQIGIVYQGKKREQ